MTENDAAMRGLPTYNMIPMNLAELNDVAAPFPEVRAAISALLGAEEMLKLPAGYWAPRADPPDMLDILQYVFGFQDGNVKNQREHIVLLLANAQSRLYSPQEKELKVDEEAIRVVFENAMSNYIKWCRFLRTTHWENYATLPSRKRLLLLCLYFLIWGEASNVRFLPECLCYIFHRMSEELEDMLRNRIARPAHSCCGDDGVSFLKQIIQPVYDTIVAETKFYMKWKPPPSSWRNYDDFNEFFWSRQCFELGWPWRKDHAFFTKRNLSCLHGCSGGKINFVEHRTFFHLYHSFHRLWIFLIIMFQALTIIAFNEKKIFNGGKINPSGVRLLLSVGPTFMIMNLIKSILDVVLLYGAYTMTQKTLVFKILLRCVWFGMLSGLTSYFYLKGMQGKAQFSIYVIIIGAYVSFRILSFLLQLFLIQMMRENFDQQLIMQIIKWTQKDIYYVGQGMYESRADYIRYMLFWLVIFMFKFPLAYQLEIKPLVEPTKIIVHLENLGYSWHDIGPKDYNVLTVFALWTPVVAIYLLDLHIWYTVFSAIIGTIIGAKQRLGEISMRSLREQFDMFPAAFIKCLQASRKKGNALHREEFEEANKLYVADFSPLWNEIIKHLREEDYISNSEMELLLTPSNRDKVPLIQWPLFLLANKIFLAVKLAGESYYFQREIWEKISQDKYMKYAVAESYYTMKRIMETILEDEGRLWADRIFDDIEESLRKESFLEDFQLKTLESVIKAITTLTSALMVEENDYRANVAMKAMQDLYDIISHDFCSYNRRYHCSTWATISYAWKEGRLFSNIEWPRNSEIKNQIKRLHSLLTIKESASSIPKNSEARRRLVFFTNSLFMDMPSPKPVQEILSFSVLTPYYQEAVMFTVEDLKKENKDGISTLFYLQTIFPDEWENFMERIGQNNNAPFSKLESNPKDLLELRLWASYRGQTLARTVRGMMYYRKALMLQSYIEKQLHENKDRSPIYNDFNLEGYESSQAAKSQANIKFAYVVSCQKYGAQKQSIKNDERAKALDIALLMQRYEALRVAFIDVVETFKNGEASKEYYSTLVKADVEGIDKEIYRIKLPGDPILGEGKPENQNHAIIFTRGDALQTIDMNQDHYFEEALKMRNLLEEFNVTHGLRCPTILGVREHIFTGSVSSLALFMSNQEANFVTLGQRVLANPLKVRMHYGHPDVFNRIFHITRGGVSKASRVINISEDIYAGFNSTLREGNVTHHEYIQVGKGEDVGLNQISMFEAKTAGGNGEQVLSRDVYRLGQNFDFYRMLSFYFTTVGPYVCTMLTIWTLYVVLYGRAYLALSGVDKAIIDSSKDIRDNKPLDAVLSTQFLFQIGVVTALPVVMGFILEQGFLKTIFRFLTMQFQLCSLFFTFSLATRTHYFGRVILHGAAKYQETGRGFVVQHIKFKENYRLYSRSHFIKGFEIMVLSLVDTVYGYYKQGASACFLLRASSWFLVISWIFSPFIFNPSGFELTKISADFRNWTKWLHTRGGIGVSAKKSWEAWWNDECAHIRSRSGRILETVLCLRYFFFQYGIVYQLHITGDNTRLSVYGISWIFLTILILLFKVHSLSEKTTVRFQLPVRVLQSLTSIGSVVAIVVCIIKTHLTVTDVLAAFLAFLPTGWGILCVAIAWKPLVKRLGLWKSIRSLARLYDALIGTMIFVPLAILSCVPFIATTQTRLMYNQAFSRGLEVSLILRGDKLQD